MKVLPKMKRKMIGEVIVIFQTGTTERRREEAIETILRGLIYLNTPLIKSLLEK